MPLLCRPLLTKDSKPRAVASSYLCQTQLAISCGKRLSKLQLESRLEGVFFSFRFSRIPGQVFPILPLVAVSAIFPVLPFWKEPGLGWKIRALKQERSDSSVLTRMSRRLRHFASHFHSCDPRRILHRAFAREATAFLSDFSIFKFKWSWSDEWFPCELPGSIFRA